MCMREKVYNARVYEVYVYARKGVWSTGVLSSCVHMFAFAAPPIRITDLPGVDPKARDQDGIVSQLASPVPSLLAFDCT